MSKGKYIRPSYHRRFFYSEVINQRELNDLLQEAFILVHRVGFTYSDVKELTRLDRAIFLGMYKEELEREQELYK